MKQNLPILRMAAFFLLSVFISISCTAQVNSYPFTQSVNTFSPISGGTVVFSGPADDNFSTVSMPMTFQFNGINYNQIYVSTNGFITFGAAPTIGNHLPISSTESYSGCVSAMGRDIVGTATGQVMVKFETNRFVIQWLNYKRIGTTTENLNFQIVLNQTTNVVNVIYGNTVAEISTASPQVGLRGNSNSDFHNRTTNSNWLATTKGTLNTQTCMLSGSVIPSSGLTFTWTPPSPSNLTRQQAVNALLSPGSGVAIDLAHTPVWLPNINFGFGAGYEGLLPAGAHADPAYLGVQPYPGPGMTTLHPSYFFWLDDEHAAHFVHPVRFVLVDATFPAPTVSNGGIQITNQGWWPIIRITGQPDLELYDDMDKRLSNDPSGYLNPDGFIGGPPLHFFDVFTLPTAVLTKVMNTKSAGLTVKGSAGTDFCNDMKRFKKDLNEHYCIDESRIIEANGGMVASLQSFCDGIDSLVAMKPCEIFIRITSHGGNGIIRIGTVVITKEQLCAKFRKLAALGVPIHVLIEACHSGSLMDKNDWNFPAGSTVITSADADNNSKGGTFTDGGTTTTESIFPYAISQCLRDTTDMNGDGYKDADTNKDGKIDDAEAYRWVLLKKPCYVFVRDNTPRYPAGPPTGSSGNMPNPQIREVGRTAYGINVNVKNATGSAKTDFHITFKGDVRGGTQKGWHSDENDQINFNSHWGDGAQSSITYNPATNETMVCWQDDANPLPNGSFIHFFYQHAGLVPVRQNWTPTSTPVPDNADKVPAHNSSVLPSPDGSHLAVRTMDRSTDGDGWGEPIQSTVIIRIAPNTIPLDSLFLTSPAIAPLTPIFINTFPLVPDEPISFDLDIPGQIQLGNVLILETHTSWELNPNITTALEVFEPLYLAAPANDEPCEAFSMPCDSSLTGNNFGLSARLTDPKPDTTDCYGMQSWCPGQKPMHTAWFALTPPITSDGSLVLQVKGTTPTPEFNSMVAVWKGDSCSTFSGWTLIAANDDDPDYLAHGGNQYSSYLNLPACTLLPGELYYIQVDGHGNTTGEFVMTTQCANDITPPLLSVPPDITLSCESPTDPSVTGDAYASDGCPPAIPQRAFFDVFYSICGQTNLIQRTWTATDLAGNTSTGIQLITTQDMIPPAVSTPPNITVCYGETVDLGMPTGSDNCGGVSFSNNGPGTYPPGNTTVVWTATDACGNTSTAVQHVAVTAITAYADLDNDGYGDPMNSFLACTGVTDHTDCNDNNANIHPGATEICNSLDDNCNGQIDEVLSACTTPLSSAHANIQAYSADLSWSPVVCATQYRVQYRVFGAVSYINGPIVSVPNISVNLGGLMASTHYQWRVRAICYNGSSTANTSPLDFTTLPPPVPWYQDADGDGYGNAAASITASLQPPGYVADHTDCNDTPGIIGPTIHPGAPELCDNLDNNCNGQIDEGVSGGTCPIPAGLFNNNITYHSAFLHWSRGECVASYKVQYRVLGAPAYTNGPSINFPDTSVVLDGLMESTTYQWRVRSVCFDNSSSLSSAPKTFTTPSSVPIWYADADGDNYGNLLSSVSSPSQPPGYVPDSTDCNDGNASIHPGAYEYCNGVDDDCDGQVDEAAVDCPTPGGQTTTNITSTKARLNWVASACASTYNVQYRVRGTSTWSIRNTASLLLQLSNLAPATEYEWRIRAKCGLYFSSFSAIKRFTTLASLADMYDNDLAEDNGMKETRRYLSTETAGLPSLPDYVKVYPNPGHGLFHLEADFGSATKTIISITDPLGRVCFETTLQTVNGKINQEIDLSDHPAGLYLIRIQNSQAIRTEKLLIW